MKIAITGTPGTGKTTVSKHLDGFEVVHLTEFAKDRGLGEGSDPFEVDVEALRNELSELEGDLVFEGHLAHHADVNYCVVLRCDPEELEERLEARGYPEEKIQENLESEAMDLILQEAAARCGKVFEADTTDREPSEVAKEVREGIENGKERTGAVDWTHWL